MTRTRHLHRSAVLAAATALFAVAGASTAALAFSAEPEAAPIAAIEVVPTTVPTAAENASAAKATALAIAQTAAARVVATKPVAVKKTVKPAAKPAKKTQKASTQRVAQKPAQKKSSSSSVLYIRNYVNAPGSQSAIDKCNLVLWASHPLWLAAHNYCGYQWLAYVPTGKKVVVTKGAAKGTYKVTGHLRLNRQGGAMPRVNADLVLQTCVGSGTGLSLLTRI